MRCLRRYHQMLLLLVLHILDLLAWYERQLTTLGVTLRLNTYMDEADIAAHPADTILLATGSLPDDDAMQRWAPSLGPLPGRELGHVWSPEAVLRREEAQMGDHVIVYDEGGNWRGSAPPGHWPNKANR